MNHIQINLDQAIDFISKNIKAIFISAFLSSLIAIIFSFSGRIGYKSEAILSVGSKIQWSWLHQKVGEPTELIESANMISEGLKARKELSSIGSKNFDTPIKLTVEPIPNTNLFKISVLSTNQNLNKEVLDKNIQWLVDQHYIKMQDEIKILDSEIKNIQLNIKQFRSVIVNLNEFLKTSKLDLTTSDFATTDNQINSKSSKLKTVLSVCDFREILSRLETYQDREKTYGLDLERATYVRNKILATPTKLVSHEGISMTPSWRYLASRALLSFIAGAILAILALLIFNKNRKLYINNK